MMIQRGSMETAGNSICAKIGKKGKGANLQLFNTLALKTKVKENAGFLTMAVNEAAPNTSDAYIKYQNVCARIIQRWWRSYQMRIKFLQTLAEYRQFQWDLKEKFCKLWVARYEFRIWLRAYNARVKKQFEELLSEWHEHQTLRKLRQGVTRLLDEERKLVAKRKLEELRIENEKRQEAERLKAIMQKRTDMLYSEMYGTTDEQEILTAEQIRKTKAFAADSSIKQHNWNIPDWDPDTSETENEIIILAAAAEDCRLQRLEASNLRKVFDSEIFARRKLIKEEEGFRNADEQQALLKEIDLKELDLTRDLGEKLLVSFEMELKTIQRMRDDEDRSERIAVLKELRVEVEEKNLLIDEMGTDTTNLSSVRIKPYQLKDVRSREPRLEAKIFGDHSLPGNDVKSFENLYAHEDIESQLVTRNRAAKEEKQAKLKAIEDALTDDEKAELKKEVKKEEYLNSAQKYYQNIKAKKASAVDAYR